MSTGKHSFKSTEASRLMRAAKTAGLKVKGVTLRNGKPYVEIDDGAKADEANDWTDVLKDAPAKKRAS